jgi:hypothetical protein
MAGHTPWREIKHKAKLGTCDCADPVPVEAPVPASKGIRAGRRVASASSPATITVCANCGRAIRRAS